MFLALLLAWPLLVPPVSGGVQLSPTARAWKARIAFAPAGTVAAPRAYLPADFALESGLDALAELLAETPLRPENLRGSAQEQAVAIRKAVQAHAAGVIERADAVAADPVGRAAQAEGLLPEIERTAMAAALLGEEQKSKILGYRAAGKIGTALKSGYERLISARETISLALSRARESWLAVRTEESPVLADPPRGGSPGKISPSTLSPGLDPVAQGVPAWIRAELARQPYPIIKLAGRLLSERDRLSEDARAVQSTWESYPPLVEDGEGGRRYALALAALLDWAQTADQNPRARVLLESAARVLAREHYLEEKKYGDGDASAGLPRSPLRDGQYWDMATGFTGGHWLLGRLDPAVEYKFFDVSPFAITYLHELKSLAERDGKPMGNVEILRRDILTLTRPLGPLAVIRAKNVTYYVPGFQSKLEEMAAWLEPGGRIILQTDAGRSGQLSRLAEDYSGMAGRLIRAGWGLDYRFGRPGDYDTVVLTKPMDGASLPSKTWEGLRAEINLFVEQERFFR